MIHVAVRREDLIHARDIRPLSDLGLGKGKYMHVYALWSRVLGLLVLHPEVVVLAPFSYFFCILNCVTSKFAVLNF